MRPARYDHDLWVSRLGRLLDHDGPCGRFRLHNCRVGHWWPVGCYVATHPDDRARYVGRVQRRDGTGFDERFAVHHQPVDDWGRVWLLPLRADVSPVVVAAVEAFLISALRPSDNVVRPQIRLWPSRVEELLRRVA